MFMGFMLGGLGCLYIPPPADTGGPSGDHTPSDTDAVPGDTDDSVDSDQPQDTGDPPDDTGAPDPCVIDVTGLAVVAVTDAEATETTPGRALWICADAYVDVKSDANLVIVERDGAALFSGPDNLAVAFDNAMVATQGSGNQLVRERHTIAKGGWASVHECTGGIRVERDGEEAVSPC